MTRSTSGRQGLPAQTIHGGIALETTDRTEITAPSPISAPGPKTHSEATQDCEPMTIGVEIVGK